MGGPSRRHGRGSNQYRTVPVAPRPSQLDPRFVDMCGPSNEERVGFAFEHPDWSAAGFDRDERDLWVTAGFDLSEATAWRSSPVDAAATADRWRSFGFDPDDTVEWVAHGWEPADAALWWHAGFNAEEADRWVAEGVFDPDDLDGDVFADEPDDP